jgi:hypothetical protein
MRRVWLYLNRVSQAPRKAHTLGDDRGPRMSVTDDTNLVSLLVGDLENLFQLQRGHQAKIVSTYLIAVRWESTADF